MKCTNCGAEINNNTICPYCGSQISSEQKKEQELLNKQTCPKCNSTNISYKREKHREIRKKNQKQILYRTVAICNDCGATWDPTPKSTAKTDAWLWVLGWIFFFPIPLTILIARSKSLSKKAKTWIIIGMWSFIPISTIINAIVSPPNRNELSDSPTIAEEQVIESNIEAYETQPQSEKPSVQAESQPTMQLTITNPRDDDNNIGDEWTYYNEINGEKVTGGKLVINAGDKLDFYSKYTESDTEPDIGESSTSYTVTEDDIINGFTVTMDLYVDENHGLNAGKSAHFIVTYEFTPL